MYAISKADLVAGADQIEALLYDTSQEPWEVAPGEPGFTVWPALSAGRQAAGAAGGTQFFVSSNAVFDDDNGDSSEIIVWALSNTRALDGTGLPSAHASRRAVAALRGAAAVGAEGRCRAAA